MATDTIKLTGDAAIEAFQAARPQGGQAKAQTYNPSFGQAMWSNKEWASDEYLDEQLNSEWTTATFDDGELCLEYSTGEPGTTTACYAAVSLTWEADPSKGRQKVAYESAHAGFVWEDQSAYSDALETLLRHLQWDDADLAEFGLASCEDYDCDDDGGYWLVADAERFAAVAAQCSDLSDRFDDLEADDVLAFLRDGTEPDAE